MTAQGTAVPVGVSLAAAWRQGPGEVRYGWAWSDVNALAIYVVTRDTWWSRVMSFDDRAEIARSVMLETVVLAARRPSPVALMKAAQAAIQHEADKWEAAHGQSNKGTRVGTPGLNFHRYWWQQQTQAFEEQITDAVAVGQIWERLTGKQRTVLEALTEAGGDVRAAESLEYSLVYFRELLAEARTAFLEWWHEGETPSGIWMRDGPPISTMALMSTLRKRKRKAIAAAQRAE